MRCCAAILFCVGAVFGQKVTTIDKLPAAISGFNDGRTYNPLPCTIQPVKPTLNFGFRFQTGYIIRTALEPYRGGAHHWYIAFRVTREGAGEQPVFFVDSIDLPAPPQGDSVVENSGTFFVGEGRYDIKWSLLDDLGRVCRQQWTIDAHLSMAERSLKVSMPPGTVRDSSWQPPSGAQAATKLRHVTVLLNAAVPAIRQAKPAADEWQTLMSILSALLQRMPGTHVRLIVFNLDQQRELLRKDDFTAADLNLVAHLADDAQRWAIDHRVLSNPSGEWDLLSNLESEEIRATPLPDTVIFLGLPETISENMAPGMPVPVRARRFFYLKYAPVKQMASPFPRDNPSQSGPNVSLQDPRSLGRTGENIDASYSRETLALSGDPDQPDPIEQAVRHLKGKTIAISSPAGFSKALATMDLR
jgi:hypothetical protein